MRGRPNLYTSYEAESQLFPTMTHKVALALGLMVLVLMPFDLPVIDQLPLVRFLGDSIWLRLVNKMLIFTIGALGLHLLGLGLRLGRLLISPGLGLRGLLLRLDVHFADNARREIKLIERDFLGQLTILCPSPHQPAHAVRARCHRAWACGGRGA